MLIILGGLPGSGKTTTAQALARKIDAVYIRIDTIEQAIRDSDVLKGEVGPAGYVVGYSLAADNLGLGRVVIADSVNAIGITREAWRAVAAKCCVPAVEIEIACSNGNEHRHRVETRATDIGGLVKPTWEQTAGRHYEPWIGRDIFVDTAEQPVDAIIAHLLPQLQRLGLPVPA
jgi:predicted kinase